MLSIRSAGFEDLPVIQTLAKEVWPSAYRKILSADQLSYMLDKIYSLPSEPLTSPEFRMIPVCR